MRQVLLAAALVLSLSSSAFAQVFTVTTVVIDQTQRQGTFQSGSIIVPTVTADQVVRIQLNIGAADYVDTTKYVWYRLFRSSDDGATWVSHGGARWTGGAYTNEQGEVNPMPWLQVPAYFINDQGQAQVLTGQLLRAEVDVPFRMRVGATIFY